MNSNIELKTIIHKKCPPFIWDINGYIGGIYSVYQYNYIKILIYSNKFLIELCK
jgi:hypothetical protein